MCQIGVHIRSLNTTERIYDSTPTQQKNKCKTPNKHKTPNKQPKNILNSRKCILSFSCVIQS